MPARPVSATWQMSCDKVQCTLPDMEEFEELLAQWIAAETRGDAAALDSLLNCDFRGDGPLGYVLTKEQWLDRYRNGELAYAAFSWRDTEIRVRDDTAVVMGVQAQSATYRGRDCSGEFRATLVAVRRDSSWSIVNLQLNRVVGH